MDETEEGNSTLKDEEDNRSSSPSSNSELGPVQDAPEDLSVEKTRPNSPQSRSSNSPGIMLVTIGKNIGYNKCYINYFFHKIFLIVYCLMS